MIKRIEHAKAKPGYRYDSAKKVYVGFKVDLRVNRKRYRQIFATKSEATKFVDELKLNHTYKRRGLKRDSPLNDIRLGALVEARLASRTERKQKEFEKRVLNYFLDLTGDVKVVEITLADLRTFVQTRSKELTVRNEPVKPQTVDRELVAIAAMLHNAGDYFDELEGYIAPRIPHPAFKKGRRERVITDDERDELLKALPLPIAKIFEFASLTGLRHSEIMRLRTSNLNRRARSLSVYRSKTDTTSEISPLTDRMLELMSDPYESGFIFTPDGKTPATFYKVLRKACEQCGIPYGRFAPGGVILHDNRHTFVTKLQQAGIDLATIQSFSGHSDKELVMRYSHARPESRKRAMAAIEGKDEAEKWREIYDKVASGELDFEAFLAAVK